MIPLFLSRRARNEVRQWLALAEDVRDFAKSIVELVTGGHYDDARALLETKIREQAAGRAAYEASKNAGPRK